MPLNDPLDRVLAALSHPTRRAILDRVMRSEVRVTDLAAPFDLSLNAVSKHVRVLEEAQLVTRRRAWREHMVSFNAAPLEAAAAWIAERRGVQGAREQVLAPKVEPPQGPPPPGAQGPARK